MMILFDLLFFQVKKTNTLLLENYAINQTGLENIADNFSNILNCCKPEMIMPALDGLLANDQLLVSTFNRQDIFKALTQKISVSKYDVYIKDYSINIHDFIGSKVDGEYKIDFDKILCIFERLFFVDKLFFTNFDAVYNSKSKSEHIRLELILIMFPDSHQDFINELFKDSKYIKYFIPSICALDRIINTLAKEGHQPKILIDTMVEHFKDISYLFDEKNFEEGIKPIQWDYAREVLQKAAELASVKEISIKRLQDIAMHLNPSQIDSTKSEIPAELLKQLDNSTIPPSVVEQKQSSTFTLGFFSDPDIKQTRQNLYFSQRNSEDLPVKNTQVTPRAQTANPGRVRMRFLPQNQTQQIQKKQIDNSIPNRTVVIPSGSMKLVSKY